MTASRGIILSLALLETATWLALVGFGLFRGVSSEAKNINRDTAVFATAAFAITGAPELALALANKWVLLAAALVTAPIVVVVLLVLAVL